MKARYLAFFSYIGTPFRSSQKVWLKEGRNYPDPGSIQGMLELALLKFRSLNYPSVVLSSRTDGGVHALNASAHFDLDPYGPEIYEPQAIVYGVNNYFFKTNSSINVNQCYRVSDKFHARFSAVSRTYLYRVAVLKAAIDVEEYCGIGAYTPIEEWKRCHFIRAPSFDIEKLKEGAKYLVGYHDFTTFKKFHKAEPQKHNRREILSIDVRPGTALVCRHSARPDGTFQYWDVEIRGRAFVHNQIRRMLGTLISVAIGKLSPGDIKVMLQVPSKHSWHSFINNGPPDGLYLCNVEYEPRDLVYDSDAETKVEQTSQNGSDSPPVGNRHRPLHEVKRRGVGCSQPL